MSSIAIQQTDLIVRLSGGLANTNVNLSLGGARSSTALVDNVANNAWDNVLRTEAVSGDVEYRCYYILNNHASLTATDTRIWISFPTPSPHDEIDLGIEPGLMNATAQGPLADESTAPTGVTFSSPSTFGGALLLGDIPFGEHKAFWIRRTVTAGAAARPGNAYILSVQCET